MFNCKLRHWCDDRDKMLQTWYVVVTTTCPLQTCYSPVTTIRPPTDSLQHGYYTQHGHYNLAITRSLRICYHDGHYELLQLGHYNPATTNLPLQTCHYDLATTPVTTNSLQPGRYKFTTTFSLLQSRHNPVTMLQPGHYKLANLVTTAQSLCWLQIPCSKRTILSTQGLLTP